MYKALVELFWKDVEFRMRNMGVCSKAGALLLQGLMKPERSREREVERERGRERETHTHTCHAAFD